MGGVVGRACWLYCRASLVNLGVCMSLVRNPFGVRMVAICLI